MTAVGASRVAVAVRDDRFGRRRQEHADRAPPLRRKGLFDDQVDAVAATTARRGQDGLDLSLVTDGLRAEREQGITIDVAYRYFATPTRSFIIGDNPGHAQYTRNMATGASTADLAVVLVDARTGLARADPPPSRGRRDARHPPSRARGQQDGPRRLVGRCVRRRRHRAQRVRRTPRRRRPRSDPDLGAARRQRGRPLDGMRLGTRGRRCSSISSRSRSRRSTTAALGARLAVQLVIRTTRDGRPVRRYAGIVVGGRAEVGDTVQIWPAGTRTTIAGIEIGTEAPEAVAGSSVVVRLDDDVDVDTRGDLLASVDEPPTVTRELEAAVCWFGAKPLLPGARVLVKHTTRTERAVVRAVLGRRDLDSLEETPAGELVKNDIGTVRLASGTARGRPVRRQSRNGWLHRDRRGH